MSFLKIFDKKKDRLRNLAAPTPPSGTSPGPGAEPAPPPPPGKPIPAPKKVATKPKVPKAPVRKKVKPRPRQRKPAPPVEHKEIPEPIAIHEMKHKHVVPPVPRPPRSRQAELEEIHESDLEMQTRKALHETVPVDEHPHKAPAPPPPRKSMSEVEVKQFVTASPSRPTPIHHAAKKKSSRADTATARTVEKLLEAAPKQHKPAHHAKKPAHHATKKTPVPEPEHEEHFHGKLFHLHGGKTLRNPSELLAALDDMSKETFAHHVHGDKNDFALWIRDVFHDHLLADRVQITRTPLQLKRALMSHNVPQLPRLHKPEKLAPRTVSAPKPHKVTIQEISYKDEIKRLSGELEHMRKALTQEIASGIEVLEQERSRHDNIAAQLEEQEHLLAEREKRLKEQEARLAKMREEIEDRAHHVDMAIDLDKREQRIFQREQEAGSAMQMLEAETQRFNEERRAAEQLLRQAVELRKEFKERDQKAIAAQKAVAEHEAQLETQRRELEALDHAIAERRAALKEHERLIREAEVPQYRHDHLDMGTVHTPPRVASSHAEQLLATIQQIRNLLVAGRLDDAKQGYAVLRETFYEAQMSEDERHQVYNLIRELYADIELSMLDR